MRVVVSPDTYITKPKDVICFLAGGISNCPDWQKEVIERLKLMEKDGANLEHLVLFNPRRENFSIYDPNVTNEQIAWEFNHLEIADIFSMYFCNAHSDQPICMYELGRNLMVMKQKFPESFAKRIIVSVEQGYRRAKDVEVQTSLALDRDNCVNMFATPADHAQSIFFSYSTILVHSAILDERR